MRNFLTTMLIICIFSILSACGGNNGSSDRPVESGIHYVLPNGTIISSPTSTLTVNQGSEVTTSISIYGGIPGLSITFGDVVLESGSGLVVSFNPQTLISGSSILSSTMTIDATNGIVGTYTIQLLATYSYGPTNTTVAIGNITVTVNNGYTPIPGTLALSPQDVSILYTESATLTLSLNGREHDDSNLTVYLSSSQPWVILLGTTSCVLSESNNTCPVTIYSELNGAGSAIITASAVGYESATTTVTVTGNTPVTYTWVSGDNWDDSPEPHYGTKGVPSQDNIPGLRNWSMSWIDKAGNFWLFGGYGVDESLDYGILNDLWKYNPTDNTWTWVSGSNQISQAGIYGFKGVPSVNNIPGARARSTYWSDESGNLWLFGGYGYDESGNLNDINDVWKFNLVDNTWTWVGGESNVGGATVYGTKGVASSNNNPGARDTSLGWHDQNDNFWLFGGEGFNDGYYNDLWKYNPNTNTWTWISGTNESDQAGVYGTKGVPSIDNIPGSRDSDVVWTDESGNLWLFGGFNHSGNAFNDLWKYNPTNNSWTWVSGANHPWQSGVYGIKGVESEGNHPGARWGGVVGWCDHQGNLWLFGGLMGSALFNDVWKFDKNNNMWAWMGGESGTGGSANYGTKGVPSESNIPGQRDASIGWEDQRGNFWLFGGAGAPNDLWEITPNGN